MSEEKVVCIKCGFDRLMRDIPYRNSDPVGFNPPKTSLVSMLLGKANTEYSHFKLTVCADCGYMEFYADDPAALWRGYSQESR